MRATEQALRLSRIDETSIIVESANAEESIIACMGVKRAFGIIDGIRENANGFTVRARREEREVSVNSRIAASVEKCDHRVLAFSLSFARRTNSFVSIRREVESALAAGVSAILRRLRLI